MAKKPRTQSDEESKKRERARVNYSQTLADTKSDFIQGAKGIAEKAIPIVQKSGSNLNYELKKRDKINEFQKMSSYDRNAIYTDDQFSEDLDRIDLGMYSTNTKNVFSLMNNLDGRYLNDKLYGNFYNRVDEREWERKQLIDFFNKYDPEYKSAEAQDFLMDDIFVDDLKSKFDSQHKLSNSFDNVHSYYAAQEYSKPEYSNYSNWIRKINDLYQEQHTNTDKLRQWEIRNALDMAGDAIVFNDDLIRQMEENENFRKHFEDNYLNRQLKEGKWFRDAQKSGSDAYNSAQSRLDKLEALKAFYSDRRYMTRPDFENSFDIRSEQFTNGDGGKLTHMPENLSKNIYNAVNYGVTPNVPDEVYVPVDPSDSQKSQISNYNTAEHYFIDENFDKYKYLTDNEKKIFNYLWNNVGEDEAVAYVKGKDARLKQQSIADFYAEMYETGKEHPWLTLASNVLTAPQRGVIALGATADTLISGSDDPSLAQITTKATQYGKSGGAEGSGSPFWYNVGTSAGEEGMLSLTTAGIGGLAGRFANSALHYGTAFESKYNEYKDAGYSEVEAKKAGLTAAGIEFLSEMIFDNPLNRGGKVIGGSLIKGLKSSTKTQILKNIAKAGLEEGTEELVSALGEEMYDAVTNHEKTSTFLQVYNDKIEKGNSETSAITDALLAVSGDALEDVASGFLVGSFLSGSSSYSNVKTATQMRQYAGEILEPYNNSFKTVRSFMISEMGMPNDSETIKIAQAIFDYSNGKAISPEMETAINDNPYFRGLTYAMVDKVGQGITESVDSLGGTVVSEPESETVDTVSRDYKTEMYNMLTGENLSVSAIDSIISDKNMVSAFEELTGTKIKGTKAEQRNIVRDFQNDAQNIEDLKLKNAGYNTIALTSAHEKVNTLLENVNSENMGKIIKSETLSKAYEELTGTALDGTMAEKKAIIREGAKLAREVYAESVKANKGNVRQSMYRDVNEVGVETVSETENVSENPKRTYFKKADAESVKSGIENVNADEQFENIGRSGSKVYSNFVGKDSGLVKKFVKAGMRINSAQTMADSIFQFMYDAGKRGTKLEVAVSAMERIHPGIKEYTTAFYYAGVNDTNLMVGKKGAKITENDVIKRMRESKKLDGNTEKAINTIAKKIGLNITFVSKEELGEGNNGSFNLKTGEIKINEDSEIPYVVAVMHESIHAIRSIAPKNYNELADLVFELITKDSEVFGESWKHIRDLYREQITDKDGNVNKDLINEEYVANVVSTLLFDKQFINDLAKEDMGFVQKIFKSIKDLFDKILGRYNARAKTDAELNGAVKILKSEFDKIKGIYESALSATESVQKDGITTASNGQIVSIENESEVMFNKAQWDKEGRKTLQKYLSDNNIDKSQSKEIMGFMDMIAKASEQLEGEYPTYGNWAVYEVSKGENGAPMSAIVKNGEYTLNIDFSTKCVKRATLDKVLNKLANKKMLSLIKAKDDATAIAVINGIIKKYGLDVACPMCFVDAKRQQILKWSKSFCDMWNWVIKQTVPKGEIVSDFAFAGQETSNTVDTLTEADFTDIMKKVPKKFKTDKGNVKPILERIINLIKSDSKYMHTMTVEDMASSQGLDAIKSWSADMYQIVNSHQGSAKPKLAHSEVPYDNDIANDKRFNSEAAFMVGGVRFQSFSDYVESLFFDYMQAVAELSAKGLPSHAYTKVIDFAKIFGLTGMKINMSGIARVKTLTDAETKHIESLYKDGKKTSKFNNDSLVKKLKKTAGLDENGELLWADESIDIEEAKKLALDPEYSKNCGIIVVGVSNAHILKLLDTDWVAQVIPYHRSGINPVVARMYNIDLFNDYTNHQNTRVPYQGKYKSINSSEIKIKDFDFYGELRKLGNDPNAPKKIADRYLEWCDKAGDLSRTEPVAENKRFIPKFTKFRKHPNYYKLLADFSMKDSNGNYAPQGAVEMNFPATETLLGYIKDSLKSQEVREAKIDKEFDNIVSEVEEAFDIEEGIMYSKSPTQSATDAEYLELAKNPEKNEARLREMVDEAAVNSGVDTDSNGKPIPAYHGTSDFGFTTVDTEYSDDKLTFWASIDLAVASSYDRASLANDEQGKVREIGKPENNIRRPKLNVNKDSAEKIVKAAGELLPEYKDAKVPTEKEKMHMAKKKSSQALKLAKQLRRSKGATKSDIEKLNKIITAIKTINRDALITIDKELSSNSEIRLFSDDFASKYEDDIDSLIFKIYDIIDILRSDYALVGNDSVDLKDIVKFYNKVSGERGIYKMYYKANNPYVIDYKGAQWNQIEAPAEISPNGEKMNTREIAKWAFEHGYDSVKYVNIVDMGNKQSERVSATVWAFMDPKNQLWSADTVTYDDNGNIIPLSERFSDSNDDLRYSKSTKRTSKLKDITPEYVRGEVTRDFESFKKLVIETMDEEIAKAKAKPTITKVSTPTTAEIVENSTYIGDDGQKVTIVPEGTPGAKKVYITNDGTAVEEKPRDGEKGKSRLALTTLRSGVLNNEQTKSVINLLKNDETFATYIKFTDNEALEEAERIYDEKGYDEMLSEWKITNESGNFPTKQFMVNGQYLLKQAAKNDDGDAVTYLISELGSIATQSGQVIQSVSMLARRFGGESRAYMLNKQLKKLESQIRMRKGNEGVTLSFPKELMNEYIKAVNYEMGVIEETKTDTNVMSAKSDTRRSSDEILAEMWSKVSEQVPPTWSYTLRTWRYAAMLSNPSTHISNMASNYGMYVATLNKNIIASTLEKIFLKKGNRTKSISSSLKGILPSRIRKATNDKNYQFAVEDAESMQNELQENNKYQNSITSRSKIKAIDTIANKAIFGMLKAEDWIFVKGHYARALTNYMDANGYTPDTITEAQLDKGREISMKEAKRNTFNDANAFADWVNKQTEKKAWLEFIVGSEFAFLKVPANVLKIGVDYSPLGLIRTLNPAKVLGLKGDVYKLRKGEISASEYIDRISQNLTGTILYGLGMFLASSGLISIGGDDDEEDSLTGRQKYSIEIFGHSWTMDWFTPSGIPIFAGVQFWKDISKDGDFSFSDVIKLFPATYDATFDTLFSMTLLENLSYTMKSFQYGDSAGEKLADSVSSVIFGRIAQYVPSLFTNVGNIFDNTKRGTYVDKNSKVPEYIQVGLQQLVRKIPFVLEPTMNAKGEPEKKSSDNIVLRAIDQIILPGSLKKLQSSAIDEELLRLYDSTENGKNVIPKKLSKYITVHGERKDLTAKEYAKLQSTFGQTYYTKLKEIVDSDYYNGLSDENKVKLLKKVKEYATEKAKDEVDSRFRPDTWLKISMETPGVYQYIIDTEPSESFNVDDLNDEQYESFKVDKSDMVSNILGQYTPDNSDYDFADKYYDYLNSFTKEVALEKNSGGEYEIDTKWINTAKNMNSRKQSEFIYAKALTSGLSGSEANEVLKNNSFISSEVKAHLQDFGTHFSQTPASVYESGGKGGKNLDEYNISMDVFVDVFNTKENLKEYKDSNGKTVSVQKQICEYIGGLNISDAEKSALYRVWYQDKNSKGKTTIKDVTWNYVWE